MRFWLTHSGEVSLHEQLVRQVRLGVLCGDLEPGERLPSTRELARRFRIHANTVSTAYAQLSEELWVERRRGSGVYVCARDDVHAAEVGSLSVLESLVARTVRVARELGFSDADLRQRIAAALSKPKPLLLLEPDAELARIVRYESESASCRTMEVLSIPLVDWPLQLRDRVAGFVPVVLPSKAAAARQALGDAVSVVVLQIGSITQPLAQQLPSSREHLVGIASHWPEFLKIAQTMLVATGFSNDALMVRDARESDWAPGLVDAASVICDSLTAAKLPPGVKAIVFPLLTPQSLEELRIPRRSIET